MRITAINRATGEETFYTLRHGSVVLRLRAPEEVDSSGAQRLQWERIDWRQWGRRFRERPDYAVTSPALLIDFDGRTARLTDRGGVERVYLLERPLPLQQPWTWLPEQEVRYGDFVLFWEAYSQFWPRIPLERVSWLIVLLVLLLLVSVLAAVYWVGVRLRTNTMIAPVAAIAPTPTATATITATMTLTATPRPAPRLAATLTPTPTVVTALDDRDRAATFTPTVTPTLAPAEATAAAAREICTQTTPMPPTQELADLEVLIEPACVKVGEFYWRLTEADWLNETESNGFHHVFVHLQSDEPLDEKIAMRWETGVCLRTIKDASGANCPMYNAGFAYSVQIEGLPSEKISKLGLGVPGQRDWAIRTSFYLTFTKTLREFTANK